jgi:hypothetical protein
MEKDTVLLDVEKYNALRDFKEYIEKGNTLEVNNLRYNSYRRFITTDEAVKIIVKDRELIVSELEKENEDLKLQIRNLENPAPKEMSINDLKKMSYWEFRKWRKS